MNYKIEDFVGIFENVFDQEFCETAISYFETMKSQGFTKTRKERENIGRFKKDDESLDLTKIENLPMKIGSRLNSHFNTIFWEKCYKSYVDKFDIIDKFDSHTVYQLILQKTSIGGGYHIWHCESGSMSTGRRVMAFILYLNDVETGGETEFLYYPKRITPAAGTLILFPSQYTHTHRGNPPISNDKYIITGWVEF